MQAYDLYQDIAQRTQGDVCVGVIVLCERENPHLSDV